MSCVPHELANALADDAATLINGLKRLPNGTRDSNTIVVFHTSAQSASLPIASTIACWFFKIVWKSVGVFSNATPDGISAELPLLKVPCVAGSLTIARGRIQQGM